MLINTMPIMVIMAVITGRFIKIMETELLPSLLNLRV